MRREIGELRRHMDPSRRAEIGESVARHVLAWSGLRPGRRVVLHAALPDEVPTLGLLQALLQRRHEVLLPRAGGAGRLEFALVVDPSLLFVGRFGALEPPVGEPARALLEEDLVLLPGVAFDRSGARLGRGGGWYDRSLPSEVQDVFGIACELQLVERVPVDAWDRRVRGVFTEAGLRHCDFGARIREPSRDSS